MKKSNKVLLIAFLSFLLIITAVHLSLSARYKSGNYTAYAADELGIQDTAFTGVQHVVLKDLGNVNLGIGDTVAIGKGSDDDQDYTMTQTGNTLYISGKDFVGHQTRSRTALWITVPSGGSVSATNVMMDINQRKTIANAQLNITLSNARLHINEYQKRLAYDSINVRAVNGSALEIRRADIRSLQLQLNKSSFVESGNMFGNLQLAVDISSEVSLSAPHLIKAKISAAN